MKILNRLLIIALILIGVVGNSEAKKKCELRVGSYNLRMNTPKDSINAWPNRSADVAKLVRYYDFDIFGTQEGFKSMLDDIKTRWRN